MSYELWAMSQRRRDGESARRRVGKDEDTTAKSQKLIAHSS
jgi:hypothetical protein